MRTETRTGGREAATRHIPPRLALSVGMPAVPAPTGWRWSALSALARLESGHTPSRKHSEYWGGDVPWISLPDAKANHGRAITDTAEHTNALGIANSSARMLPARTVCLSRTASVGYVTVMGRPMATSQDFVNWVCSDRIDPDFLKYAFLAEGKEGLLRFASGAVHQTIYFPEAKAFHICHPFIDEQRRIGGVLDDALEGIVIARANAERNLRNARALFESEARSVFTQHGGVWAEKPLADLVRSVSTGPFGSMLHQSDYAAGGVPIVNPINIVDDTIVADAAKGVSPETVQRLQRYVLLAGDVVVGRRGEIGRCAVVQREQAGWLCGTGCFFVRPSFAVDSEFLARLLRSGEYRNRLERAATGTTMKNLSNDALRTLVVAMPPFLEQQRVVAQLQAVATEVGHLESVYERKLTILDELKRSLLHHAFTGQLTGRTAAALGA